MNEYRRAKRKQVSEIIEVHDCMTEQVIGRISNLSETGMMLMCNQSPFEDALYQLRFTISDDDGRNHAIDVGSHHLWSDEANSPGQYWAGFRFIDMPTEAAQVIRDWVDAPDGP